MTDSASAVAAYSYGTRSFVYIYEDRACIARKIRGVVTVDQGDVRALLSGAKDDSKKFRR